MLTADELASAFGSDDPYAIREHVTALTEALADERAGKEVWINRWNLLVNLNAEAEALADAVRTIERLGLVVIPVERDDGRRWLVGPASTEGHMEWLYVDEEMGVVDGTVYPNAVADSVPEAVRLAADKIDRATRTGEERTDAPRE